MLAGIDYSMTCPAICVGPVNPINVIKDIYIEFISKNSKLDNSWFDGRVIGSELSEWNSDEKRFDALSAWAVKTLQKFPKIDLVVLEGYAMGAKGKTFHIGENTGMLKHKLWKNNIPFLIVAPSTIKKLATGKGNADKAAMFAAFIDKTKFESLGELTKNKIVSPLTDIVDSYYLYQYAVSKFQTQPHPQS